MCVCLFVYCFNARCMRPLYISNNRVNKRKAGKKVIRNLFMNLTYASCCKHSHTLTHRKTRSTQCWRKSNVIVNCNGILDTFKWIGWVGWGMIAKHHDCSWWLCIYLCAKCTHTIHFLRCRHKAQTHFILRYQHTNQFCGRFLNGLQFFGIFWCLIFKHSKLISFL